MEIDDDAALLAATDRLTPASVPAYADVLPSLSEEGPEAKARRMERSAAVKLCGDAALQQLQEAAKLATTLEEHLAVADAYRNLVYIF